MSCCRRLKSAYVNVILLTVHCLVKKQRKTLKEVVHQHKEEGQTKTALLWRPKVKGSSASSWTLPQRDLWICHGKSFHILSSRPPLTLN